ncbi:MAG: AMP-binding protein [Microthrixaceae bacterium]
MRPRPAAALDHVGQIRDPDGNPVPVGALGEIWMAGPHLIRGYWNRPDETAETIVDGWLHTGDLGRLDEDGFLYITDRAKDMVLRGGENVYCAEVEAAIYEHPAVYEAAVYGLPHERLGESSCNRAGPGGRAPGCRRAARVPGQPPGVVQDPQSAAHDHVELPRNASGKMLKRELRDSDLMEDQDLTPSQR